MKLRIFWVIPVVMAVFGGATLGLSAKHVAEGRAVRMMGQAPGVENIAFKDVGECRDFVANVAEITDKAGACASLKETLVVVAEQPKG